VLVIQIALDELEDEDVVNMFAGGELDFLGAASFLDEAEPLVQGDGSVVCGEN